MSPDETRAETNGSLDATASSDTRKAAPFSNALAEQFAALIHDDAQLFDPIRFDYLQAMQQRAMHKTGALQQRLMDKIDKGLEEYRNALANQRQQADAAMQPLTDTQRQSLAHLYQHHAYQTLIEAAHTYQAQPAATAHEKTDNEDSSDSSATLDDLIVLINQQSQSRLDQQPQTLADQLRAQEQQALHLDDTPAPSSSATPTNLTAVELLRDSLEKQQSQWLVNQSIQQGPENPGPLNPHQLAIRSLTSMRDLSPAYLTRFVAMMDSLFWLEKVDRKFGGSETKTGKSAAKRKR